MVSTMSKTPLKKRDKNRIRKRTDVFTYFQEVQVQMIPPPPQLIHWMQIARRRMTDAMLGSMEDTVKDSGDHIWKLIAKNLVNCADVVEVSLTHSKLSLFWFGQIIKRKF